MMGPLSLSYNPSPCKQVFLLHLQLHCGRAMVPSDIQVVSAIRWASSFGEYGLMPLPSNPDVLTVWGTEFHCTNFSLDLDARVKDRSQGEGTLCIRLLLMPCWGCG